MAFNPNAVFISPSSLADFQKCPQLYYYRNVYKTPRGLKIQLINPSLALGQAVHDTLENYCKLPPQERSSDQLFTTFNWIWQQLSGKKGGYSSTQEEDQNRVRAQDMLGRFLSNPHFTSTILHKSPSFPKTDLAPDLILTGKLDWLESTPAGLHIVDFKTGKNEEKEDSLQLPIYAVLVNELFHPNSITASYWYLDKDDQLTPFTLPDLTQFKSELIASGQILQLARQTNSFRCQSGGQSCWACKDMQAVATGQGELVTVDPARKQEIYILPKTQTPPTPPPLPF